jgi:hypothetical protein
MFESDIPVPETQAIGGSFRTCQTAELESDLEPGWRPDPTCVADDLREGLYQFLLPLLLLLDAAMDVRLVRTFRALTETILSFRNRSLALLLSELGGYLLSPEHAPAGTKRIDRLLASGKWTARIVHEWLWRQAQARKQELEADGQEALVLWDESVLEKPESRKLEGLCPVRSSKAKRLARSRPGPGSGKPTFVNGLHWVSLLLIGRSGPPMVAAIRWFTTRGKQATDLRSVQAALLRQCLTAWKREVLHIFDRGYAGAPWLWSCLFAGMEGAGEGIRFVIRWPRKLHLLNADQREMPAWQIARGQRSWEERVAWDSANRRYRRIGFLALLVRHPGPNPGASQQEGGEGQALSCPPLWLVVARPLGEKKEKEPWYLLTSDPIQNADDAWRVVLAYARRWQIEMCFRYNKSELGIESLRLWTWERREKLLMVVTLCYAFLLSLLTEELVTLRLWLLRHFCHRTGKRQRDRATSAAPLYRLRSAISRLWLAYPEPKLPELTVYIPILEQSPG